MGVKKIAISCFALFLTLALCVSVFYTLFVAPIQRFSGLSKSMHGKRKSEVVLKLGNPEKVYTSAAFSASDQKFLAGGYEPDPPVVDCDEVLQYAKLNVLSLLYVKEDTVVQTYVGGT